MPNGAFHWAWKLVITVRVSTIGHVSCLISEQQRQQQPFNGCLSVTTRVGRYQKKHSPAHTHPGQRTSFITFLHLQRSTASSFQVLFGLPHLISEVED